MRPVGIFLLLSLLTSCVANDAVTDRQYGQLIVCHEGQTLTVSNASMFMHEQHGDSMGPCPDGG